MNSEGYSAPEIDLIETKRNKYGIRQVASHNVQFALFTHDYL
jgi:hypothetical protein